MNNFWQRVFTGAAFLAVMIFCIAWNFWSMTGLFLIISVLGLKEFYSLVCTNESLSVKAAGLAIGILLILLSSLKYFLTAPDLFFILPAAAGLVFPSLLITLLFTKNLRMLMGVPPAIFGVLYSVVPFCYLIVAAANVNYWVIRNDHFIILGYFFLIWANDTFAYLCGRAFGRRKLFERISPKKTWEGTIGGTLCTQGMAFIFSIYVPELAPVHWHALALLVSVFGTLGDLVESMFKRSLGVKDSGHLLPGHGGILDRFDGVLVSAPFVVTYLMVVR